MSKFKYQEHIFMQAANDKHTDKFLRLIAICPIHDQADSANARFTVITHEGTPIYNDNEDRFVYPPSRTHGGKVSVLLDQTEAQLDRRRSKVVREWQHQDSEEHEGERGLVSSLLKVHFGEARHATIMRSLDLMPVMARPDGSLVLDGEDPGPGASVIKPIDTAPKPVGWGAW